MLKNNPIDFQPEEDKLWGIYRGVVEDNVDPEKMGRCKVRVFGINSEVKDDKDEIDGITTDDLPWAEPALGLFEGSVTGFGSWTIPLQGSHVFIFFERGNILQPRFFASVPGKPTDIYHGFSSIEGFHDPKEEYPNESTVYPHKPNQLGESDYHRLARHEGIGDTIVDYKESNLDLAIPIALGGGEWDEPDPYYAAEYPHNKVFSTHTGITIEVDDTPGQERIHVYHPSKSYIEIDKEGNVVIRNAKDKFEIVDDNKREHIMNNYHRKVDNHRTSKVEGDYVEEVDGDYTLLVKGKIYISADGGIDMWGGANINEDAPEIYLNSGIANRKSSW